MMVIYCTNSFYEQIHTLQKNKSYVNIITDVFGFFTDKNIEELHITKDIISNASGTYSLNKYRIANSAMGRGKRGSYRCICACLIKENKIYLGTVYPKTGAEGIDNITKEAYKAYASDIKDSIKDNTLYELIISNQSFVKVR
jgi:hypothetical protein